MSAIHGNYHGYYTKRPFVKDPRLALLPVDIFKDKTVLDVGCNEGWVTCEIGQSWRARRVIGVDIDDTLVRAAWRRRINVWSQQEPLLPPATAAEQGSSLPLKRKYADDQQQSSRLPAADYFPLAFQHSLGPLPIPLAEEPTKHSFPHNVSFRTADWVSDGLPDDTNGYDVVIAFSITKWIHLNGGDEALTSFFRRVSSVLKSGGIFLLEPQAWETYKHAKRANESLKQNAKGLQLRPENFDTILASMGFDAPKDFGVTGEAGFRRPVKLYVKL